MTHVDRLIDVVARHVTPGRLAASLDRLTAEGALTPHERTRIAADEAFGSLEGVLRSAELAGHDPDAVSPTSSPTTVACRTRSPPPRCSTTGSPPPTPVG